MNSHYSRSKTRYVAFDLETTGLSPQKGHRVIEIGAYAVEGDSLSDSFHGLINPKRPISTVAQRVHGITREMLRGQPQAEEVMPAFHRYLSDSTLIAHNARFDIEFLRHEFARLRLPFNNPGLCTLKLSRQNFPGLPNYRLSTVARHLFGDAVNSLTLHRALADARLTAEIWMEISKRKKIINSWENRK